MKYNETAYYDIISLCEICFNIWIIIIDKSKITLIDSAFTLYVYHITVYDVYGFISIEFIKRIFIEFFLQCLFKAITKLQFSFGSLGWVFFFSFYSLHSVKCFVEQEANFNGPFSSFCLYRFLCYLLDFISNTQHKPFKSHLIYLTIHGQWKSRRQIKKTSRFTWSLHSWHGIHTLNDYWEFFKSIFFIKFNNRKLFHTQNLNQNWYILIISLRTAIFVSVLNTGSPARTVWTVWALFLFFIKCTHHTHSSFIFRL